MPPHVKPPSVVAQHPESCPHSDEIQSEIRERRQDREDIHQIKTDVRRITDLFLGNMDDSKPGLFERIRDLENSEKARRTWLGIIATTALGAAVLSIWGFFFGK